MNKMTLLIILIVASAASVANAQELKMYPGTSCYGVDEDTNKNNIIYSRYDGRIINLSSSEHSYFVCPIIRDDVLNYDIEDISLYVRFVGDTTLPNGNGDSYCSISAHNATGSLQSQSIFYSSPNYTDEKFTFSRTNLQNYGTDMKLIIYCKVPPSSSIKLYTVKE